jgi:hypothetical protein
MAHSRLGLAAHAASDECCWSKEPQARCSQPRIGTELIGCCRTGAWERLESIATRLRVSDFSKRHRFSAWPNADLPAVAAGVYVVWDENTLVYAGMSGREFEKAVASEKRRFGLVTRLASHATGRLSGDQFCVYVANRLVIPALDPQVLPRFASGELSLDALTRAYIHERLEYQFAIADSSTQAYALERECRNGTRFGIKPLLNPL